MLSRSPVVNLFMEYADSRCLDEALRISANFTYECIRQTAMDENASWYGVAFEKALPYLIDQLREDGKRSSLRF